MTATVLIVDDEPRVLSALRRSLSEQPFSIETFTSPHEALHRVEAGGVDLVLTDHDMPGMSGAELLTRVRACDASVVRFMFTGKATLELAIQAINEGTIDRFFCKPANQVDLAASLRAALEQRALVAEARRLLWAYRRQGARLAELEARYPEIGALELDDTGSIVLEDLPNESAALLALLGEVHRDEGAAA